MTILVSALEPSANKYLANIATYLQGKVDFIGVGDKEIVPDPLYKVNDFSVMGLKHIIPKLRFFKKALDNMADLSEKADTVLLLDSASFNLKLAKKIKQRHPQKKSSITSCPKFGRGVRSEYH